MCDFVSSPQLLALPYDFDSAITLQARFIGKGGNWQQMFTLGKTQTDMGNTSWLSYAKANAYLWSVNTGLTNGSFGPYKILAEVTITVHLESGASYASETYNNTTKTSDTAFQYPTDIHYILIGAETIGYSFVIIDGINSICAFPVIQKSTNYGGFYDTIANAFYGNANITEYSES